MFEKSIDELHQEILAAISNTYQKTVGFPTYDITRAMLEPIKAIYDGLQELSDKMWVDNLHGEELERFVKERKGVKRKQASRATGSVTATGTGTITKGDLFETVGGVQFAATETVQIATEGIVPVEAVQPGAAGDVGAEAITLFPKTIQGMTAVTNPEPTMGGYEAEDDDSLRARYYEALQKPATSGNIYHYMQWAKEVPGCGDAKVFPLWAGDNTVQVVIIDDEKEPADQQLVNDVQAYIDPGSTGTGQGQAPIGAHCTVTAAGSVAINVAATVQRLDGYDHDTVLANVQAGIRAYLQEIAFAQNYVSYAKIANAVNDAEGVRDYTNLTVNGGSANIEIADKSVAIVGTVSI